MNNQKRQHLRAYHVPDTMFSSLYTLFYLILKNRPMSYHLQFLLFVLLKRIEYNDLQCH